MSTDALKGYIEQVTAMLEQIPRDSVAQVIEQLKKLRGKGACLYVLGNGGSESLAQHLVLHLRQHNIRAFDLMADPAWLTATSNDYGYNNEAIALLDVLFQPKDMLLVISCSGKSENVKSAVRLISAVRGQCIGILGNGGGRVLPYCSPAIVLPGLIFGLLEDCFSAIVHMIDEGVKS